MDFSEDLLSALVGGLIAGYVALYNFQKNAKLQHVTSERKKWRDDIRTLSSEFIESTVKKSNSLANSNEFNSLLENQRKLKNEIWVRLNPNDLKDTRIIQLMESLINRHSVKALNKFSLAISNLLKHDWERSKLEVGSNNIFWVLFIFILCSALYYCELDFTKDFAVLFKFFKIFVTITVGIYLLRFIGELRTVECKSLCAFLRGKLGILNHRN